MWDDCISYPLQALPSSQFQRGCPFGTCGRNQVQDAPLEARHGGAHTALEVSPGLDQGTKPKQQQVWYCSVQEGLGQLVAVMVEAVEAGVLSGASFSLSLLSATLPS